MTTPPLVSIVLGTRPEAIKLAPVIMSFQKCGALRTRTILTGQHREMVNQVMKLFQLSFDKDLALMEPNQTLTHLTATILEGLRKEFLVHRPSLVLVQGDTTTALASAMAAFYEQIPVGHIEAGLRTNDIDDPFPEEGNRCLISQITKLHFSPTIQSAANLQASGVIGEIHITGNTVIDALLSMSQKKSTVCQINGLNWKDKRVILATVHRRENWGTRLNGIAYGFFKLLERHSDVALLLPLHKNPAVRKPLNDILKDHPRAFLTEPLAYDQLVAAMRSCSLVLTDSGGIQEEAATFGKPVLILRRTTERSEAVEGGTARLIGTDTTDILNEASLLLKDDSAYRAMSQFNNPFGDGKASDRILTAARTFLNC
uniref:UDP-N-acetylglucosamine 2-epimerase (non-hydrolyzing) n=1 Tax=Paulinella chromatophora TaxID=39717 RepID=B1X5F8_PAUCH|nr:UDP-N-acetylglucosamine 2-epimerase [Paulinella chromatophora]ACB43177.1 UDP-N-acetylglucosamine 2-epimerase [Paulinella chromatophora]